MQGIFSVFSPATIALAIGGVILILGIPGFILLDIFLKRREREETQVHWYSRPRVVLRIGLSLFAFILASGSITDALGMYYHLNFLIVFLIDLILIVLLIALGIFMPRYILQMRDQRTKR
jgi:hypothetical protein